MDKKLKLFVISHTHWDREWYQTFQGFRKRLVFMIDELIDHLEKNGDYKFFHLDGQTILLEDYLEIRPENEKRLRDLIMQGRIIIGPWYVMPDEFLVSGESLVRNIIKGFDICKSYGAAPMKCGYVPDIFGHNSQMPQLFRGFGIQSAVLYRGVGDYLNDAFCWEGADGSSVLAMKLDRERNYSNFYYAVRWPFDGREYDKEELVSRMKNLIEYSRELAVSDNLLMLDGCDHIEIEPKLTKIISILNEKIEGVEFVHSTIEEYEKALQPSWANLEKLKGELFKAGKRGLGNQVLKNVLSSMVHLKQMNNECETLLTGWAEPFDIVASFIKKRNNRGFFDEAWKILFENHPHDSICGCSISRVHKDNEYRFDQVKDISEEIIKMAFEDISSSINTRSLNKEYSIVLFNASQRDYEGVVEAEIEFPAGSQDNFKIFDERGNEVPYQLLNVRKRALKGVFRFRRLTEFVEKDYYRVAFTVSIPSVGYRTYWYEDYKNIKPSHGDYTYKEFHAPTRYPGSMRVGHRRWENKFLRVTVNNNGTLDVEQKGTGKRYKELLIFEDGADTGDGYNYVKPIKDSVILSLASRADFSVEYDGRFAVMWKITHYLNIPEKMADNTQERSASLVQFKINTLVKMKKNSSKLEFTTFIDNNAIEHRLRVLFPTYIETNTFLSSTPFFLQERDINKEDSSTYIETETGVFPNQGVVLLKNEENCLALYNKGLYEVEVTEDKSHTLCLTLFRSFKKEVGRGETGEMSLMKKNMAFEYALDFKSGNLPAGEVMLAGEEWRTGIKTACTTSHEGLFGASSSFLKVNIKGAVLSCFKQGKEGLKIVRLYNCTSKAVKGNIEFFAKLNKVYRLNLNEEVIEDISFDSAKVELELKSAEIVTLGIY